MPSSRSPRAKSKPILKFPQMVIPTFSNGAHYVTIATKTSQNRKHQNLNHHYKTCHASEHRIMAQNRNPKGYFVKYNKNHKPCLYDEVPTRLPKSSDIDAPLSLSTRKQNKT